MKLPPNSTILTFSIFLQSFKLRRRETDKLSLRHYCAEAADGLRTTTYVVSSKLGKQASASCVR